MRRRCPRRVERADSPDGVLLLVDLGSAILSAEMALEFVDPELAGRVTISSAPLVEGLVAAVVVASTGAALAAVAAEAQRGLLGKQDHLGDVESAAVATGSGGGAPAAEDADGRDRGDQRARSACAAGSAAGRAGRVVRRRVTLAHLGGGRGPVDASSLSLVATLNARRGDRLRRRRHRAEAEDAVAAVVDFASRGFDDLDDAAAEPAGRAGDDEARPGGSGLDLAIGPALVGRIEVDTSGYEPGDPAAEQSRSRRPSVSAAVALAELAETSAGAARRASSPRRLALLADPDVVGQVDAEIGGGTSAPAAWSTGARRTGRPVRGPRRRLPARARPGRPICGAPRAARAGRRRRRRCDHRSASHPGRSW